MLWTYVHRIYGIIVRSFLRGFLHAVHQAVVDFCAQALPGCFAPLYAVGGLFLEYHGLAVGAALAEFVREKLDRLLAVGAGVVADGEFPAVLSWAATHDELPRGIIKY
jgi:hypothetical protein